ncbi:Predicted transcriptional regulator [Raoultella terrigena]|uniref:Predicted transcriptional regulator n=1 Tax=Raoultella terrigena TaxID=577 RepID=A0A3P8M3C2_RAOTE|nr:Predicted transcriptional regulator [Raoultella terrigena]
MNGINQVKQLRLQHAWSQEQLAELAGVSVRTIQRIENGDRPGLETLSALAAVFEVNVACLSDDAPVGHEESLDLRIEEAKERVQQESSFFRSLSVAVVVLRPAGDIKPGHQPRKRLVGVGRRHLGRAAAGESRQAVCLRRNDPQLAQARLQRLLRK